jgi:hypothetical protein
VMLPVVTQREGLCCRCAARMSSRRVWRTTFFCSSRFCVGSTPVETRLQQTVSAELTIDSRFRISKYAPFFPSPLPLFSRENVFGLADDGDLAAAAAASPHPEPQPRCGQPERVARMKAPINENAHHIDMITAQYGAATAQLVVAVDTALQLCAIRARSPCLRCLPPSLLLPCALVS